MAQSDREQLAAIAEQWVSLWNTPVDWALFEVLHADVFEDLSPAGRSGTKQAFADALQQMTRAFPDLRTQINGLAIDTDQQQVAIRWSATGTNESEFLGIGPTGKFTRMSGIEIIEVKDGRIVRRWGEWDITDHA